MAIVQIYSAPGHGIETADGDQLATGASITGTNTVYHPAACLAVRIMDVVRCGYCQKTMPAFQPWLRAEA